MFLSHQQPFRHDADRLHPLRRTESDRDLAYLIRTLLRFSAQRERRLSSPTPSAACRKPGSAQSAPTVPAAGCRRRIGCTPRREGSGRASWRCLAAAAIAATSTGGTGRKPYPRCLCWRQQREDGAAVGLAIARPVGSPPTSHTDIVISVGCPGRTLLAGGWNSPCGCGTWPLT